MKKIMKSKKILLMITVILGSWGVSVAQNSAIETVAILMQQDTMIHEENVKAVEQIEKARENEKTSNWAKMWYYRGRLYLNIHMSNDEETKKMVGDPLNLAYESLLKVNEGEKADRYLDDARPLLLQTAYQLYNEAYMASQAGNNKKAIENYGKILNIIPFDDKGDLKRQANISRETMYQYTYYMYLNDAATVRQAIDYLTSIKENPDNASLKSQYDIVVEKMAQFYPDYFNTTPDSKYSAEQIPGLKKLHTQLLTKANENIQKLIDLNFLDPVMYIHMSQNYVSMGDTAKALDAIAQGKELFETNMDLINAELDLYLKMGKTQQLIEQSNEAIAQDPNNKIYYFVRGVSYDKLGETEKAIADYKKAVEIDPYYYDGYYNLGAAYINQTEDIIRRMNDPNIKFTQKEYDALAEKVDLLYIKALPFFEKALEVAEPENYREKIDLGNTMKGLYQRLLANYPEYKEKYTNIKADIKAWEEAAAAQ